MVEEGIGQGARQRVRETIAKIQAGGVVAFAEEAKGLPDQMSLLDIDRDEFNFRQRFVIIYIAT